MPGKRKYGGMHWPHALKQGSTVTCSRLPGRTPYGASFLSAGPMTLPAWPCMSKPVSSQFQICAGLFARSFAIKNASKLSNQASTSLLEIFALFFSRGRALRNFTYGLRFILYDTTEGVALPSLSRNILTAPGKDSLDAPKPRFANSMSQSANWLSSCFVRIGGGPLRLPISTWPLTRS